MSLRLQGIVRTAIIMFRSEQLNTAFCVEKLIARDVLTGMRKIRDGFVLNVDKSFEERDSLEVLEGFSKHHLPGRNHDSKQPWHKYCSK